MNSEELHNEAKRLIPGGVSSPVRAYKPYPVYIKSGSGSKIRDVDGKEYIDYCMGFGPLILGHANPTIISKVKEEMDGGVLFGAPIEQEITLAKKITSHFPMDMVRFVNTGTEATMSALRLARGYTKRDKIIKIEGAFHGAHDAVLAKAGSGAATIPSSPGVPDDFTKNTILVPYNDLDAVESAIKESKDEIAALILEPIMGNVGVVLPKDDYLESLREITASNDILLIFDEVITGFRIGIGGVQSRYGIVPDLTTLGKIVGGGFPIGIFGGRADIMERVAPNGDVYQAGTFSGNPISLTAGIATIDILEKENVYESIDAMGESIRKGLNEVVSDLGLDYVVSGIGSMFQIFFTGGEVKDYNDVKRSDLDSFMNMFRSMLKNGVFLPPSQFETNFVSYAHTSGDVEETIAAYEASLRG
ncbi:MAG: glutamate-1-semialdehyde 2,1-aminomutase [Halobacteriota archaeon]|nr:glutamate-1-semialdehyde 2,1-aminomutase [Halobacteriota archaeon]